jgi:hypothetical protein
MEGGGAGSPEWLSSRANHSGHQDSAYIVALPETTLVLETNALQDDLRRAGLSRMLG